MKALEILGTVTKQGLQWSSEEVLSKHFQATFRALDDEAFPVKVQAALSLTEMIIAHESGQAFFSTFTSFKTHYLNLNLNIKRKLFCLI